MQSGFRDLGHGADLLVGGGLEEGNLVVLMLCLRGVFGEDSGIIFILHISFPSIFSTHFLERFSISGPVMLLLKGKVSLGAF